MGEVGSKGLEFHYEVGAYAAAQGIQSLLALGEQTRSAVLGFNEYSAQLGSANTAIHFASITDLNIAVQAVAKLFSQDALIAEPYAILVKGSRFMRMERVVSALNELLMEGKACS